MAISKALERTFFASFGTLGPHTIAAQFGIHHSMSIGCCRRRACPRPRAHARPRSLIPTYRFSSRPWRNILSIPFQMVNKIALSNVIDGPHTGASGIVAEVMQGLLNQPSITPTRLVTEVCSTAFEYFAQVASCRAGNTNPPHTRECGVEVTRSSSSIISNRVGL